jgi:CheY-like chemotaxis protein
MTANKVVASARARILVVDDEPSIAAAVQRALKRDYDVVTETSSKIALTRVRSGERFDVIIADLMMPNLSGANLHAEIQKFDLQQAERIIFLTGAALTPAGRDFLASVPNRWIEKPFDVTGLRRGIADALGAIEEALDASPREPLSTTDDAARNLAKRFDLAALDAEASTMVIVSGGGSILWVNAAWHAFGVANGATPEAIARGVGYFEAVQGELRTWILDAAARCSASGEVFENDYECSSPTVERKFRMRMMPVSEAGLLIEHSLRLESPHTGVAEEPDPANYRSDDGLIVMCSNCRRVRRFDKTSWDWVPTWVAVQPERVSHGLCFVCFKFYYH